MPKPIISSLFDKYYLLKWQGKHLKRKMLDSLDGSGSNQVIEHDGIYYIPIFLDGPEACYHADQVWLSFRSAMVGPVLSNGPMERKSYVLIRVGNPENKGVK